MSGDRRQGDPREHDDRPRLQRRLDALLGARSSPRSSTSSATAARTSSRAPRRADADQHDLRRSRKHSGCTETDNNGTDFAAGAPSPRNTLTAGALRASADDAPSISSTTPANGATSVAVARERLAHLQRARQRDRLVVLDLLRDERRAHGGGRRAVRRPSRSTRQRTSRSVRAARSPSSPRTSATRTRTTRRTRWPRTTSFSFTTAAAPTTSSSARSTAAAATPARRSRTTSSSSTTARSHAVSLAGWSVQYASAAGTDLAGDAAHRHDPGRATTTSSRRPQAPAGRRRCPRPTRGHDRDGGTAGKVALVNEHDRAHAAPARAAVDRRLRRLRHGQLLRRHRPDRRRSPTRPPRCGRAAARPTPTTTRPTSPPARPTRDCERATRRRASPRPTPPNGAGGVPVDSNVSITFSEPVNVDGRVVHDRLRLERRPHGAPRAGGPTTFTLDPDADFAASESCTVTVVAANVTDQDTDDPPDTMARRLRLHLHDRRRRR